MSDSDRHDRLARRPRVASVCRQAAVASLAVLLIECLSGTITSAQTSISIAGDDSGFAHLPLLYRGPDPTANYFMPVALQDDEDPAEILFGDAEVIEGEPELADSDWDLEFSEVELPEVVAEEAISDNKDGFFQKVSFTTGYIDRRNLSDYGVTEFDLAATFALPLPRRSWPLLFGPAFNVRMLDGPTVPDLPAQLYELRLDMIWVPRLTDRWTAVLGLSPGFYSDFEVDNQEAWRLTGVGLLRFDWVPDTFQLVGGVLYLNREDVDLLPAGGIIWKPSSTRHYQLVFPRPEAAHLIQSGPGYQDWLYIGGEFGGNSYSFDRGGTVDQVTLRDFRILLGLRRKKPGGAGYNLEVGWVMGRQAEFTSGIPDATADDTAIVRGGVRF